MLWSEGEGVVMNPVVLVLTMSVRLGSAVGCMVWRSVADVDGEVFGVDVVELDEEEEEDMKLMEVQALVVLSEAVEWCEEPESNLLRLFVGLTEWSDVLLSSGDRLMSDRPVLNAVGVMMGSLSGYNNSTNYTRKVRY